MIEVSYNTMEYASDKKLNSTLAQRLKLAVHAPIFSWVYNMHYFKVKLLGEAYNSPDAEMMANRLPIPL